MNKSGVRFDVDINAIAARVGIRADLIKRKLALDIWSELMATTPVDTGRARAGWSMGPSVTSYVPRNVAKPNGWRRGDSPYYDAPNTPTPPTGDIIVIYNNVEYIIGLYSGTSKQAPKRFVERAAEKVKRGFA